MKEADTGPATNKAVDDEIDLEELDERLMLLSEDLTPLAAAKSNLDLFKNVSELISLVTLHLVNPIIHLIKNQAD